jgi:hypothetical protein
MTATLSDAPAAAGTMPCRPDDLPPVTVCMQRLQRTDAELAVISRVLTYCKIFKGWKWVPTDRLRHWLSADLPPDQAAEAHAAGKALIREGYLLYARHNANWCLFPTAKLVEELRAAQESF